MAFFKSLICFALVFGISSATYLVAPRVIRAAIPPSSFYARAAPPPPPQGHILARRASPPAAAAYNANPKDIQVTAYSNTIDPATGSFQYGYQQNDGAVVSVKGYLNQNGKQVIEGSYSYVDAVGTPVQIQYVADENGYQAVGDAVPQMDPIIAKSVAYLKTLPPSTDEKQ